MSEQAFEPNDAFLFEDLLGVDDRRVMESARDYATSHLKHRALEANQESLFHLEIPRELGERGLLGPTIPKEYGGGGLSYTSYGLIARELERIDSGYRSFASVQSSLVMYPIHAFGSVDQKKAFLPGLARGELIGAFALTEPDHGSDPGSMETDARKVEGGWTLNGTKSWITNAPIADIMIVWARDWSGESRGPVRGFIVEKDTKGVTTERTRNRMSLRASITGKIRLESVFVPDTHILPEAVGLKAPFACLDSARFGISWGVVGAAENCYQIARRYVLDRKQFGYPLAAMQLVQTKLADMVTEITRMQLLAWRLGTLKDTRQALPAMISLTKRANCGSAQVIARTARDMLGANGITGDYRVIHHMMNLESVNTYEGTYDIHGLILGRELTGIQAFVPRGNDRERAGGRMNYGLKNLESGDLNDSA